MGWIGKLMGGEADKATPRPVAATANDAEPVSGAEVDAAFYRWLTTAGQKQATPDVEKQIIAELTRLAQSPVDGAALVPRVPAIIPQLMRTLRDDDMNASELSRQLQQDLVLVAEVYREANRPCYRPRYNTSPPVDTIEGAIMLLGQNGMRMLLARVAFRPIISMQSGLLAKKAAPLIWRQSEKCAQAASLLAPAMRANAFEAYLAGLMANVGIVVAFRLIDQMHTAGEIPQSDAFIDEVFAQGGILSARIAALWEFPAAVTAAIEMAGHDDAPALSQTLALADRVSKLRMLVDANKLGPGDPFVINGLSKAALTCFDKLEDEADE